MSQILSPILNVFKNHKLKLLSVIALALVFFVLMFPGSDLGDLVAAQVNRNPAIYVQFDELNLSFFPTPGIGANEVAIEPRGLPSLKAESISAHVLLGKLLGLKLGVSVSARKIFKGDVDFSYAQGAKAKSGIPSDEISIQAEGLNLDSVSDYLRSAGLLPLKLVGNLKLNTQMKLDHLFADQPSGTASLEIPGFAIPSQTIMVDFNGVPVPQQLPNLEFGKINVRSAKIGDGVLDLQDVAIGDGKSEINGKIKGTIGLQIRSGPQPRPEMNSMDLAMDLMVDKSFLERNQKSVLGGFLILIPQNLKQDTPKGTRLAFRMRVNRPGEVPNFSALAEKL